MSETTRWMLEISNVHHGLRMERIGKKKSRKIIGKMQRKTVMQQQKATSASRYDFSPLPWIVSPFSMGHHLSSGGSEVVAECLPGRCNSNGLSAWGWPSLHFALYAQTTILNILSKLSTSSTTDLPLYRFRIRKSGSNALPRGLECSESR